jgi:GNAT superfamily N-acetyltransferase
MRITIEPVSDGTVKSRLCAEITAELPMWFGQPAANARYVNGIADRDVLAAALDGHVRGIIALEVHFALTCNIWWLGVSRAAHRHGLGRALVDRAADHARARGCRRLAVETVSPRWNSPEYELTRRFYAAVGFAPFVEFEPEPGAYMMWMLRDL